MNLRFELRVILYISLGIIIFVDLIFANVTEKIPVGYNIGVILTKLSYSYISALVFYFLVVHYKRQDEKRKYYIILNEKLNILLTEYKRVFKVIYEEDEIPTIQEFEENILKNKLAKINPLLPYPGVQYVGRNSNWIGHILTVSEIYKQETNSIFENSTFIDVELVVILKNLNNNKLFYLFNMLTRAGGIGNDSLELFCDHFHDYMIKVDFLNKYIESEIKKYL